LPCMYLARKGGPLSADRGKKKITIEKEGRGGNLRPLGKKDNRDRLEKKSGFPRCLITGRVIGALARSGEEGGKFIARSWAGKGRKGSSRSNKTRKDGNSLQRPRYNKLVRKASQTSAPITKTPCNVKRDSLICTLEGWIGVAPLRGTTLPFQQGGGEGTD